MEYECVSGGGVVLVESKSSRGYILPENVAPEGMICLRVYVPDDPLYLAAFSGMYERLGTWQVWEKDGTNRASQAAQHWKDVIDFTRQNGWIGACGMSEECCEALIDAINNISIVVNVPGGGGCTSVDREWRLPLDWEAGLPDSVPVPSIEETAVSSGDLCDTAHQTHARIYELLDNYPDLVREEAPYASLLDYIQSLLIFLVPPASVMFEWMADVSGNFYDFLERDTLLFWDGMRDEFVCAIVENNNAAAFYSWLTDYISQNAPNFAVRTWLITVLQMVEWSLLYDGEFNIEAEYVGSDCSACASPPPGSYILRQKTTNNVFIADFPVDGGDILSFANEADESHYSSGGDSWLYLFDILDAETELPIEVNAEIVSFSGWTAPVNTAHPVCVQGRHLNNEYFEVVPLGELPENGEQINATKWLALHSATQFSVNILIGDI